MADWHAQLTITSGTVGIPVSASKKEGLARQGAVGGNVNSQITANEKRGVGLPKLRQKLLLFLKKRHEQGLQWQTKCVEAYY